MRTLFEGDRLTTQESIDLTIASLTEYGRKSNDERKADGSQVKNPGRVGPLTMDARRHGMATVLEVQLQVNEAADRLGRPSIDLLNREEVDRIEELIAANTWPNRWTGDELPGNCDIPELHADGSVQALMF